ncbi:uncharacterized protein [Triticum aestivum]|uniref:uncharacterized protein n=1 Tax=Triticum aestivum TaxID=4565 RepID=UPI001D026E96|nr:uncharacterized protein LOC123057087 [Triticum aestivum]
MCQYTDRVDDPLRHSRLQLSSEEIIEADDVEASHADVAEPTAPVQTDGTKDDEVVINGTGHTEPNNPVALSKHSAKEELAAFGKGKWNADLTTYAALNAQDIHSGYLNRLYTSRDYEAGLVNMMKDKYEAELKTKENQVIDLQEALKTQQAETSKAKEELASALSAMEQLKEKFKKKRAN